MTGLPPTDNDASSAGRYRYAWSKAARDGFRVRVAWDRADDGGTVLGAVADENGDAVLRFALQFAGSPVSTGPLELVRAGERIEVTLTLQRDDGLLSLHCNLPLDAHSFFDGAIATWPWTPPAPAPVPAPDRPDDDAEVVVEAGANASDLAPFIWLHPPDARARVDAGLRFARCAIPAVRDQYAGMDAAHKRQAAQAFLSGAVFVADIDALGPPVAGFPAARAGLAGAADTVPLALLLAAAQAQLQLPGSVPEFLASAPWQAALVRVWQSLCALALAGQPAQAPLAAQLADIVRVGHYLDLLSRGELALAAPAARRTALAAAIALPDQVAPRAPAPLLGGADDAQPPNSWEVLGLGQLTMLRQHCVGYLPGELADVVNVMPHSRQDVSERTVDARAGHAGEHDERQWQNDAAHATSAAGELADTVHDIMTADGMAIDMSNVTPSYANLNMMLSGSGAQTGARSGWSHAGASRLVRRLAEQAAARLGERVGRQRGREWQALREWRRAQSIDNAGARPLVGIYRWVDRVVRVRADRLGTRLVLAFVIQQPARAWLAQVAAQPPRPLTPPPLPPAFGAIQSNNYQALGAAYGVTALEAPPPDTLVLSATVSGTALGDSSLLRVPDGYQASGCIVTMALGDATCTLACSVGGVEVPAPGPSTAAPLSVTVPPAAAGPLVVQPAASPVVVSGTATVDKLLVTTGAIPLTVVCSAPLFSVTVTLTCARVTTDDFLLTAWQLRIQALLQRAWQDAWHTYEAALNDRIGRASGGHGGALQRQALRQACIDLLQPGSDARRLAPLFDWRHMTWQYEAPTAPDDGDWPPARGGEATAPASGQLFQRFLAARSAHLLLPVRAGAEDQVLFQLQFMHPWAGPAACTPVTEATVDLLEELAAPPPAGAHAEARPAPWTIRVPTAMMVLQDGSALPCLRDPLVSPAREN